MSNLGRTNGTKAKGKEKMTFRFGLLCSTEGQLGSEVPTGWEQAQFRELSEVPVPSVPLSHGVAESTSAQESKATLALTEGTLILEDETRPLEAEAPICRPVPQLTQSRDQTRAAAGHG